MHKIMRQINCFKENTVVFEKKNVFYINYLIDLSHYSVHKSIKI